MSYVQPTSEERYVIYHLKLFRLSLREIGRRLGRSHAIIGREIRRNGPVISSWVYWHEGTHQKALQHRKLPRHYRKHGHATLVRNWSAVCVQNGHPMSLLPSYRKNTCRSR